MRDTRKLGKSLLIACLMVISAVAPISLISGNAAAFGPGDGSPNHAPILIDGNADFIAQKGTEGWTGTGAYGDPIIIENYDISTAAGYGISISNTDLYFTLNSIDLSLVFALDGTGIILKNVTNALINGVVSQGNKIGLSLVSCSFITIQGGAIEPKGWTSMPDYSFNGAKDIYIYNSNNITLSDVSLNGYSYYYGTYIAGSQDILIDGGEASSALMGMYIGGCTRVTVQNFVSNYNTWNGIDVRSSNDVQITDVYAIGNGWNGIYLSTDSAVTVSGTEATPSTLQLDYNIINGIYAFNCVDLLVDGGEFIGNYRSGIFLNSCINPQVLNTHDTASGNYYSGISLVGCINAELDNDKSTGNLYSSGFFIGNCTGVMVTSVVSTGNDMNGIYLKGGKDITISTSTLTGNLKNGVYGVGVENLLLSDLDVSSNTQDGLFLVSMTGPIISNVIASLNGFNGVQLVGVSSAAILGGTMNQNTWNGIYAKSSPSLTISGATANQNYFSGIYIAFSADLLINLGTSASFNLRDGIYTGICSAPTITDSFATDNAYFGVRSHGCLLVSIISTDLSNNGYGPSFWPNAAPIASFDVKRIESITEPIFDASASLDYDGTLPVYHWDFGDGSIVDVATPITTHQYAKMDNYVVKLTVQDNDGVWSPEVSHETAIQTNLSARIVMPDKTTVGKVVSLSGVGILQEVCKDTHGDPVYVTVGASVAFDPLRTIVDYEWDFDDGSLLASGPTTTHSWSAAGTYDVGLRVQDDQGRWSLVSTSRIYVSDVGIAGLSLIPGRHSLFPRETTTLEISAVDGAGNLVSSATNTIHVNATRSNYGWTGLPAVLQLVGGKASIAISCSKNYSYNITADVSGYEGVDGSTHVTINNRTVEITVYGLGQMPLGSDMDVYINPNPVDNYQSGDPTVRGKWGDYPMRFGPMSLSQYISNGPKIGSNIDTTDYMHVEARNLSEVNLSANPLFFPKLKDGTGGKMTFTWSYHYLNQSEFWWWNNFVSGDPKYPQNNWQFSQWDQDNWGLPRQYGLYSVSRSTYDGWEHMMNISITMDESAAWVLIGMPSSDFTTDPEGWWQTIDWDLYESNNLTVKRLWEQGFMTSEGGSASEKGRLDIKSCDDQYAWAMASFGSIYRLKDNHDGTITMNILRMGYGEDTVLARWLFYGGVTSGWNYPNATRDPNDKTNSRLGGIIPWEPYYDRFSMSGDMNATAGNITLDACNIYAWRAQKSMDPNVPADTAVWRWEQIRIDYSQSGGSSTNDRSEMDIWYNNAAYGVTFDSWDPCGVSWPRTGYIADQSPNVIYLWTGESLIIQRPRTLVSGILPVGFVGISSYTNDRTASGYDRWIFINEKWGNATVHPLGCYPGTSVVDKGTGDLTIVGPFTPKVDYYPDTLAWYDSDHNLGWLWRNSAPLIEYWIQ